MGFSSPNHFLVLLLITIIIIVVVIIIQQQQQQQLKLSVGAAALLSTTTSLRPDEEYLKLTVMRADGVPTWSGNNAIACGTAAGSEKR